MTKHNLMIQWYRFVHYCIAQPLSFFSWKYGSRLSLWANYRWNKLDPPWPAF